MGTIFRPVTRSRCCLHARLDGHVAGGRVVTWTCPLYPNSSTKVDIGKTDLSSYAATNAMDDGTAIR